MKGTVALWTGLLVLFFCYESITAQQSIKNDEDAKNFIKSFLYNSTNDLQRIGNNRDILISNANNVAQNIANAKTNANNLAKQTKYSINNVVYIIDSAASVSATKSQACADTAVQRKSKIVNATSQQIEEALKALDILKPVENEIANISARLNANTVEARVTAIKNCVNNVVVTVNNVAQLAGCISNVVNAFSNYLNDESNKISTQYNAVTALVNPILNSLYNQFNKIINDADEKAKIEAEAVLDCAGLSAQKRVDSAKERISTINAQVDVSLSNGVKDLLNAISNTKNTLNNNLANATKVINDLLAKVKTYGQFFSYLAPNNATAIQQQVDSVTNSSKEQLGRVKTIYDEVVNELNALNVSLPNIYNEYKTTYTEISSVNFTALISTNINERLNTGKLQTILNDYIVKLVNAANQATANLSAKISQYNKLIEKVNTVTSIRINAEFIFAINVTKSIENIYIFGGIELKFSADKIIEQLQNSSQVVSIIKIQNQSNILYNQVKEQLNNTTFLAGLQSTLNSIISAIDILLKNNPDLNREEVKQIINQIIEYATVRINGVVSLSLQDLLNIYLGVNKVNASADLVALQEAIKKCFTNSDQYAAIICSNKVISVFQNNNTNILIELQQYYNSLNQLPVLVLSFINNITNDAAKSVTDLYNSLINQTKPLKVDDFIRNLNITKETNIDTKIKEIQNILTIINNIYTTFGVNVTIDYYFAPYKNLLNSLSNNFTRIDYSSLINSFPELKNQTLNQIKLFLENIALQTVSSIQTQINNIIIDLNLKFPSINAATVNATCAQYAGTANYSMCVDAKLEEFKQYIISVNNSLNVLITTAVQINSSFNFNVSQIVLIELIKVYNLSVDKAVNTLTFTVTFLINSFKTEINKYVDIAVNKINEYKNSVDSLVLNIMNPIKTVLVNVQQQYPNVNLDKYYNALQILIDYLKNQIIIYLELNFKKVSDIKTAANGVTIDIKAFEWKLNNCLNSYASIDQVIQLCVVPAINEINIDIKTKNEILQKLLLQILAFFPIDIQIQSVINMYINIFNVNSTVIINDAKQYANTTDYIQNIQKDIDSCVNLITAELSKLKLELQYLKQYSTDYLSKLQAKIDEAVKPFTLAINTTLSVFPNANLTKERDVLKKLVDEVKSKAITIVTNELNKYLTFIADIERRIAEITKAYANLVDDLNKYNLTVRCKRDSVSDQEFRSCVANFYNNFKVLCTNFTKTISGLRNSTINVTGVIDLNINGSISVILDNLFNVSTSIGVDIYKNYNITGQNIIDYAMDLKTYNVTPIMQTILQITFYAEELDRRNTYARGYGNYTLFTSGTAIYDIVGPGRAICGQKSVDAKLKNAQTLIAERSNYTLSNAPDLLPIIKSLFKLANDTNEKLFYQISLLDETRLKQVCPLSYSEIGKQYEIYQCVIKEVSNFGKYYEAEIVNIKNYTKSSFDKLKEASDALNQWRLDFVLVEASSIIALLEQESENFYRECNATVEKLINFSLFVATSHYNNFQQRIISNYTEINVIADRVISRNYSGYTITPKLEAASQVVLTAIDAVLASNKSYLITSEIYLALTYLIQNSSASFDSIIANFTVQSVLYKTLAANLIARREEIQKSINYTYLYARCYDDSSPFPLTDLAACGNNQTYTNVFLIGNNRTWTSLLAIKQDLIYFDTNSQQIIKDGADLVEKDFKKSAIFFAYRLYKLAGLPVPPEVASQVEENRCVQGVTTNKYYCVITT